MSYKNTFPHEQGTLIAEIESSLEQVDAQLHETYMCLQFHTKGDIDKCRKQGHIGALEADAHWKVLIRYEHLKKAQRSLQITHCALLAVSCRAQLEEVPMFEDVDGEYVLARPGSKYNTWVDRIDWTK